MITKLGRENDIGCRQARRYFAAPNENSERHLRSCSRCALEYRLFALKRAALDAAAAQEPIAPDEDFFRALRARIARGPELYPTRRPDESWTAALLLTARQLIPAMGMLLLLIAGATVLWDQPSTETNQATLRPRERVVFSDMYDLPAPTREDVLETLVAAEEKENGK